MALIVEDGSIVPDANSYVSLQEVRDFASMRGVVLSTADADVEAQVLLAMDYVESYRSQFRGLKTDPANQSLQWPRTEVTIDGWPVDSNVIPRELRNAISQLVVEQFNGVTLFKTVDEPFVIQEKVGVLETKYSDKINTGRSAFLPAVEAWLLPLLSSGYVPLRTQRI